MKSFAVFTGLAAIVDGVVGHATFQQLWVNGKDLGTTCVRLPTSNNPVDSITGNNIRCNANSGPAASKCSVPAGQTVTVEMHQHSDRLCTEEAIGGAHYGPVMVYLSKVDDASTADGSTPFFKIFQDTWGKASSTSQGSDDFWGTKDLNNNCGKMDVTIPSDLAAGDYLLRAEVIALHSASGVGGAQFYLSCYQITVTDGGSSNPSGVLFPGAYKAADPGIQINIYQQLSTYIAPGPAVISGGVEAVAGKAGSVVTVSAGPAQSTATPTPSPSSSAAVSTLITSAKPATTSAGSGTGVCAAVAKWQQCGGTGYTGCTTCASGSSCVAQNAYYSQCT